jgi:anti-sigma-K factor RskA
MDSDAIHELAAAHALDALDVDERTEFEEHLASCERCRADVAELQEAAAALAFAADAAEPPPRLREQLLERARAERGVVIPLRRRRAERVLAYAAIPAAAAAIGFGIWAGMLQRKLDHQRVVAGDASTAAAVLSDPRASQVALSGDAGLLVVGRDRRGVLVVRHLPAPPPGKTYEAWIIEGGRPRAAGTFGRTEIVVLPHPVPPNAVVAITIEPRGGSPQPTQKPLTAARA